MKIEIRQGKSGPIALVTEEGKLLTSLESALELLAEAAFGTGVNKIALKKETVADEFFVLSNGLAGAVLEKFVQYGVRLAVYGDYSMYTSKPLKDFIYESNKGREIFFAEDEAAALQWLSLVP